MKKVYEIGLLVGAVLLCSPLIVQAQNVATATVMPCLDDRTPGRPTLKQPQPDDKPGADLGKSGENGNCEPLKISRKPHTRPSAALKFEGLVSVDESQLRSYIDTHQEDVPGSASASGPGSLASVVELVKKFLEDDGYRHAKVTQRAVETNAGSEPAILVIDEGVRTPIAEYRFEGNHIFPTATLANELSKCMAAYKSDYYNAGVLDYCRYQLDRFAKSQGYLKAQFHDPQIREAEAGLIITMQADEGLLYRVGKVTFDGDLVISLATLQAGPIKTGTIANGKLLSKWLYQDLKQVHGEQGYVQYTAAVNPEFRITPKGEGIVDFAITIDSGPQFRVRRIAFAGQNLPNNLSDLMLIHDGDLYNQALFERSIETLNNTGLFEFIDKEKDADYKTDDEEALLDIVIKLTRKSD